jgi:hypothetical protein
MAFGFGVAQAIGMEKAKPISILELLRMRQTWLLVGLIFLGRMAYFLYWGTLLEIDSLGYLKLQTALYHPPLYSAFNGLAIQIGRSVDAIVVAQSLLYSLSASLLVRKWITTSRFQLLIAILLALEPCSGKLACTVMAETVFLSLLMLAWFALPTLKSENWKRFSLAAICIGFALGLAYQTRYAAPVFVVAVIIWMLTQRLPWRRLVRGYRNHPFSLSVRPPTPPNVLPSPLRHIANECLQQPESLEYKRLPLSRFTDRCSAQNGV